MGSWYSKNGKGKTAWKFLFNFSSNYIKTSKSLYSTTKSLLKHLTTCSLMISLKQHGNALCASSDLQIKV